MKHPHNWKIKTLEDVAEIQTGLSKCASRVGDFVRLPYLRVANVQDGRFDLTEVKEIDVPKDAVDRYRVVLGDLLLTEGGDFDKLGRGALWTGAIKECVHQNHIFVVRANSSVLDRRFLALQTQGAHGRAYFQSCSKQSTNLASINSTQLKQFPVLLPPLPEQRKIADILGTWDEALEKLDALIAAKERRNQALMQQLLFGKIRVGGFSKRWRVRTLADIVKPVTRTVSKPKDSFMAAGIRSHGKGVFLKPDFEPEDIALEELFEIQTDDLIVNITFAWEGAAAVVPASANGALVSHRFPTFRVSSSDADLSFIRHYILTKRFVFDCGLASPGGAGRNRVLSKAAFLAIELNLPDVAEQRAIGATLDTAAAELRLLRDRRAVVDEQKRGLMQKILTGKVRVSA